MNPQAKAYLEALAFGVLGAVLAAAIQSVQAQGFGHLDWAVVGAAALTAALAYLQIALRWMLEPPPAPPSPAAFAIPLQPLTSSATFKPAAPQPPFPVQPEPGGPGVVAPPAPPAPPRG